MKNNEIKYFLSANSSEGFYSLFKTSYDSKDGWKAYILKGGPGTGKSSFMKKILSYSKTKGLNPIAVPCGSDPDSLDGVIIESEKLIILDGTAPHTLDPVYPGISEKIINFGEYWDDKKFIGNEKEIINLIDTNKQYHSSASRYINAVGELIKENYNIEFNYLNKIKALNFANDICKKFIKKKGNEYKEWDRFLTGITPKGIISYGDTVLQSAEKVIIIEDNLYASANIILQTIREYSLSMGHTIITIKNPFLPSFLIDGIIIPDLSLAIVNENKYIHYDSNIRRVHSRRFINNKLLRNKKEKIKFNKKAESLLLNSAIESLKEAKNTHDKLEKNYINAMNFEEIDKFTNKFINEIFNA